MDCDCEMPDCMACFIRYVEAIEAVVGWGCGGKHLYWQGIELETRLAIEELIEEDIPDEIYELRDSW